MKTRIFPICTLLALGLSAHSVHSQTSSGMRDVATHDSLSQKLRMAQQADPIRNLGPPAENTKEDPAKNRKKRNLVENSTILCFRGQLTLVPKLAVLNLPARLEERTTAQKGAKVRTWQDFYRVNRGWIRTMEVTREQALGHAPFSEESAKAISESSVVIVATYQGGPISVLPPKDEELVSSKSELKSVTFR